MKMRQSRPNYKKGQRKFWMTKKTYWSCIFPFSLTEVVIKLFFVKVKHEFWTISGTPRCETIFSTDIPWFRKKFPDLSQGSTGAVVDFCAPMECRAQHHRITLRNLFSSFNKRWWKIFPLGWISWIKNTTGRFRK